MLKLNELRFWEGKTHKKGLSVIEPKWSRLEINGVWSGKPEGKSSAFFSIISGNVLDCFAYDLRRLWVKEL